MDESDHIQIMRIVSHTCSNTEILCALGLAESIVGVDDHSDYPQDIVAQLPRIGPDLAIDVKKVRELKPDWVVTSLTVPGHELSLQQLRNAGYETGKNLLVCEPRSLDDVAADMENIGQAMGVAKRGHELAARFRHQLEANGQERAKPIPVLVEWWPKPVIAPGRDSWVTQLLPLAGAYNPWAGKAVNSLTIDAFEARKAAPEAIIMSWCGVDESKYHPHVVARRDGWETIPAIQQQQIHPISEAYLGRPGPRLVEGLRRLRAIVDALPRV